MASLTIPARSPSQFPQHPKWPKSITEDQAAIDQARRELGPDADAKDILARAQQIKREVGRGR